MTRDMDTVKMSHEEMIDTLKGLVFGTFDRTTAKEREALDMVIKLQTEPSADVIPIPRGATNGDMIKAMFTNIEYGKDELGNVFIVSSAQLGYIAFRECWWNAPYKRD
jgi:predicted pyridoxine 5'-phosphate oxidase superfamily flavin-nucleotide-binding protein